MSAWSHKSYILSFKTKEFWINNSTVSGKWRASVVSYAYAWSLTYAKRLNSEFKFRLKVWNGQNFKTSIFFITLAKFDLTEASEATATIILNCKSDYARKIKHGKTRRMSGECDPSETTGNKACQSSLLTNTANNCQQLNDYKRRRRQITHNMAVYQKCVILPIPSPITSDWHIQTTNWPLTAQK